MPMTSPVDFISGPSTTFAPGKRPHGMTASFTQKQSGSRSSGGSPRLSTLRPAMTSAAHFASGTPVAFDTKGTVRLARGLASMTKISSPLIANCTLMSPRTPRRTANARVTPRSRSTVRFENEKGGMHADESPEWMPASSMCSSTPPT